MRSDLVLDAEEQAMYDRETDDGVVHHGDRGVPYLSSGHTERMAEGGIEAPVGSVGDSYDSALAELVIGLFKAELLGRAGPWRGLEGDEAQYHQFQAAPANAGASA